MTHNIRVVYWPPPAPYPGQLSTTAQARPWSVRGTHSPLRLWGHTAERRAEAVQVKGVVAVITHELLVGILLAATQAAGALVAGLARVVLALVAEGLVLPWTQQLGQLGQGQPHATPHAGDTGDRLRTHFSLGFQPWGSPRPDAQS